MGYRELIVSDLNRLTKANIFSWLRYLLFNASFRITFWFRIGSALKSSNNILSKLLYPIVFYIHYRNQYKTGIQLSFGTSIGRGVSFSHFSGIVINNGSIIGDNSTIFQNVTIGSKRGKKGGVPIIGHNVVVAPGANVIGPVNIGDNVFIGANALVINDIPDNAVVGGVPAKILNFDGKYNTLLYLKN